MEEAYPAVAGREGRGLDVDADGFGLLQGLRDGGEVFAGPDQAVALRAFFHTSILAGRDVCGITSSVHGWGKLSSWADLSR